MSFEISLFKLFQLSTLSLSLIDAKQNMLIF